ncbi:helix-turn-helix domain-containing protein [Pantoea phytobeneficialis]|uniref:helix-turn-helix domain-containing protein n=1 Tax=Pantoea phytobeneficialis TaxID=2052056 RepID=UPI003F598D63
MQRRKMEKDWHKEDILAAVRKKKKSLAALSRESGLASGTLNYALNRPWARGEHIIAQAIGVAPEDIWPSRYLQTEKNKKHQMRRPVNDNGQTAGYLIKNIVNQ